MQGGLLFIHPSGHLNDLVIPAGTLSCLNAARVPKLGRYSFEVTDEEIASARVVAVDVHWALALPGFERLLAHVRALRPDVPVIVGGVTAGHYFRELLARLPVDYVLQGDSEESFAALVEALFDGRDPGELPNVHRRGHPSPPLRRMSAAAFDATDCLRADWFPTYQACSQWDARAFPPGRTIPVSRGCAFRCPECYGSYADTFGPGYHLRSPARVVELLKQAEALGTRNLRLFLAKPPEGKLSELIAAIAAAGPFRFGSAVGLYLCTPPSEADLRRLSAAFENRVDLSLIPPDEHVPALAPAQLEKERARWRAAARYVAQSPNLRLDVWTTQEASAARLSRVSRELLEGEHRQVKVSSGAVWSVTRPTSEGTAPSFDEVLEAMRPVWTFYAGRLLSPSLDRLLAPFQLLDELDGDPLEALEVPSRLEPLARVLKESWERHHLPTLPGLGWAILPIKDAPPSGRASGEVALGGDLVRAGSSKLRRESEPGVELALRPDHKGVTLRAKRLQAGGAGALVVLPMPIDGGPLTAEWLAALEPDGFVALRLPPGAAPHEVRIDLRVQQADVVALDAEGALLARGRADLRYFSRRAGLGSTPRRAGSAGRESEQAG